MLTAETRFISDDPTWETLEVTRHRFYDLHLRRRRGRTTDEYLVQPHMRLQFDFVNRGGGDWSRGERTAFTQRFERLIRAAWDMQLSGATRSRGAIRFQPSFDIRIGERADEHWRVVVLSVVDGSVRDHREYVLSEGAERNGRRASQNLVVLNQTSNARHVNDGVVGNPSIHEYGHMLGYFVDEYESGSAHLGDAESIMNVGTLVRARHVARFLTWATAVIEREERRESEIARSRAGELDAFRDRMRRGLTTQRDAYRHIDDRQRRAAIGGGR